MRVDRTKVKAEIVVRHGAQAGGDAVAAKWDALAVFDAVFEVGGEEYRANANGGLKRGKVNNRAKDQEEKESERKSLRC